MGPIDHFPVLHKAMWGRNGKQVPLRARHLPVRRTHAVCTAYPCPQQSNPLCTACPLPWHASRHALSRRRDCSFPLRSALLWDSQSGGHLLGRHSPGVHPAFTANPALAVRGLTDDAGLSESDDKGHARTGVATPLGGAAQGKAGTKAGLGGHTVREQLPTQAARAAAVATRAAYRPRARQVSICVTLRSFRVSLF